MNNPLQSAQQPQQQNPEEPPDPMLMHAQVWQHMHSQDPDALEAEVARLDYGLPILGALAADPKVTAKKVMKVVADMVGAGKIEPSAGVETIAQMPADPDKLRPWLQQRYAMSVTGAVHAKATLLAQHMQSMREPATPPVMPMASPLAGGMR